MPIDDRTRLQLHRRLEEVLGAEDAATLMDHLPPVGWADVATKQHVDALAAVTKAELRAEIADLRTELRTGLADVRTELHRGLVRQTWITGGLIASFNAALAAILTSAT
jgi:hypothetical protein